MSDLARSVGNRLRHSLSPDVAAIAGLRLDELQQAMIGRIALSDEQLERLAVHFGIKQKGKRP
jgi:hypothetical protein